MAYTPDTWVDGAAGGTPITAAWLNRLEAGVAAAASSPATTDGLFFVSRSANASDANDGLSWGSAKATVTAALSALGSNPGRVLVSVGTYPTTNAVFHSDQAIEGFGPELTVLQLPSGANADVLSSSGFSGLTGGGTAGGVTKAAVRNLTVDGNKTNQTIPTTQTPSGTQILSGGGTLNVSSAANFPTTGRITVRSTSGMQTISYTGKTGTSFTGTTGGVGSIAAFEPVYGDAGYGLRAFWYDCDVDNVHFRNCVVDGLWSEWGADDGTTRAAGAMENRIARFKSYNNGRNGVTHLGPNDSLYSHYQCITNGRAGFFAGNVSQHVMGHQWGSPQLYGYDVYATIHASECISEVTNVPGSRGVRFGGSTGPTGSAWRGWIFVPVGSPISGAVGVEFFGASSTGIDVDAQIDNCVGGTFLFSGSDASSGHRIRARVSQSSGPIVTSANTSVTSGSNGVDVSTFTGSGVLNVLALSGFPTAGAVMVQTGSGTRIVTYTGQGSGTLTGCTATGSGVLSTGATVSLISVANGQIHNDLTNIRPADWNVSVIGGTTAEGPALRSDVMQGHGLTYGHETISRLFGMHDSAALLSGQLALTYFTARKSTTVTSIKTRNRGTAAVGLTLARVALYSVDPSTGNLTLLAASTSDTSMWTGAFAVYTKTIASTPLTAGQRYAVGVLAVGTPTMPTLYCWGTNGSGLDFDLQPRPAALLSSQTDIPSTITDSSLTVGANIFHAICA
jgi:hypothetical protein